MADVSACGEMGAIVKVAITGAEVPDADGKTVETYAMTLVGWASCPRTGWAVKVVS